MYFRPTGLCKGMEHESVWLSPTKELRAGFYRPIMPRVWISRGTGIYRENGQEASECPSQSPAVPKLRQGQENKNGLRPRNVHMGRSTGDGEAGDSTFGQVDLRLDPKFRTSLRAPEVTKTATGWTFLGRGLSMWLEA